MKKIQAQRAIPSLLLFALFTVLSIGGYGSKLQASEVLSGNKALLKLSNDKAEYKSGDVPSGVVSFTASIENQGERPMTFAHPNICFPADYQRGESIHLSDRYGKSEILLIVEKPDGQTVTLREGPHFFDPGNISHFTIKVEESNDFHIGWFFQNARGRWEGGAKADTLFMDKGEYRVRLLYRNFFPKAFVYDRSSGKSSIISAWTGELQSNEVSVLIK